MKQPVYLLGVLVTVLWAFSCSSGGGPALPLPAGLVFPNNLSECTTGVDLGGSTSRVTFQWNTAANTFDYELTVESLTDAGDRQTFVTEETSQEVVLSKSTGYRWQVVSRNEEGTETAASEQWMFVNAGSLQSYPPFPANLIAPANGVRLDLPANNEVTLEWSVSDLDGDVSSIELFASTDSDPAFQATLPAGSTQWGLPVTSGTRYYWKVRITDESGNSSTSNIQDFFVE